MKRIKKILKWTGIVILILVSSLALVVAARQNLKFKAPYPDIKSSKDPAIIARGKHLVYSSAHCMDCHSKQNADSMLKLGKDVSMSGGRVFDLAVGKVYTRNITPDIETGIGRYTDPEIARALRYGVRPDGTAMFDFMPFHNTSDEDLEAIISYLRSTPPVKNKIAQSTTTILGKVIKAFLIKPVGPDGEVLKSVQRDTTAVYGKYLASSIANCRGCHTKRDLMTGGYIGADFAGGLKMDGLITPNLTPDSTGRIFNWSKENFIERFRMGKLMAKTPMPWNSFKRMTDDELTAIYNYLKTLKPVRSEK